MLRGFRRGRDGTVVLRLSEGERLQLAVLLEELAAMLEPPELDPDADPLERLVGIDPTAEVPDEPGLARLLPDAYRDDPTAAAEFRRFTQRSLREGKAANARAALATLTDTPSDSRIQLDADAAQAWMLALNDLRLHLGTNLGVTDDAEEMAETLLALLGEDEPLAYGYAIYDWLTWLQDSLVRALRR